MLHHRLRTRAKHLGHAVVSRAKAGLAVVDRGLYHAHRAAHAVPEALVEQYAGPEAREALRAAKRSLRVYEDVRQIATGEQR